MDKEDYKQRYSTKLLMFTKPTVYGETVPNNATNVARSKAEAIHTAKILYYQFFAVAERETCDFILPVVNDIWVCKLHEPFIFYTDVVPLELLKHLQKLCGGLQALDVLVLQNEV